MSVVFVLLCQKTLSAQPLDASFFVVSSPSNCAVPAAQRDALESVTVAKVYDGDTLRLNDGRKVRLLGINTPELGRKGHKNDRFSVKAKQAVINFFDRDNRALLLFDSQRKDKYGRLLAHVYNTQGLNLESVLLYAGLGWHVAVAPNFSLIHCLAGIETLAQKTLRGVWANPAVAVVLSTAVNRGGYQRVVGRVGKVTFGKSWWINLEGAVAGKISPKQQGNFTMANIERLDGTVITLEGWVYPAHSSRGKPWRINIDTPYALN